MGMVRKTGKVVAIATYPLWMPVSIAVNSFRRNGRQGREVISGLAKTLKARPESEQLTVDFDAAIESGQIPEPAIKRVPRSRVTIFIFANIAQFVHLAILMIGGSGRREVIISSAFLVIWLFLTWIVYMIATATQTHINSLFANLRKASNRAEKIACKTALWYRFYLSKKRVYLLGCLLFSLGSLSSFLVGSYFWAALPLIAAGGIFLPNLVGVQNRLWQLRHRRLSKEERGGVRDFLATPRAVLSCFNPEFFNRYPNSTEKHYA